MRTAAEIREAIKRDVEETIETQSAAAERVSAGARELQQLRDQVSKKEREVDANIGRAKELMGLRKLAQYLGMKPAEVENLAGPTGSRTTKPRRSRKSAPARPSATATSSENSGTAVVTPPTQPTAS